MLLRTKRFGTVVIIGDWTVRARSRFAAARLIAMAVAAWEVARFQLTINKVTDCCSHAAMRGDGIEFVAQFLDRFPYALLVCR